jgi:two-component system response regulator HydG
MLERTSQAKPCAFPFQGGAVCKTCRLASPRGELLACSRMVAESEPMRAMLARVPAIAATDASIVILGESGSGKEVLARALHANGPRASAPFVAVNVAALPGDLLESELFGHARGAFTGATVAKAGLFHEAHGGTLFLDEVAEMPLPLQAKLLRAVQDGEVRRVGETRPFRVDVRIICATHQDLTRCVAERRFREDLYYRLKVFTLVVPPLRARREDVLPLAHLFLTQEKHASGRFTARAEQALRAYRWPGNVRELQNACKHGAALSPARDVDLEHLPQELSDPRAAASSAHDGALRPLAEVEREHVLRVLEACGGRQGEAARILGIGRTSLWRKLHDYGLSEGAP